MGRWSVPWWRLRLVLWHREICRIGLFFTCIPPFSLMAQRRLDQRSENVEWLHHPSPIFLCNFVLGAAIHRHDSM